MKDFTHPALQYIRLAILLELPVAQILTVYQTLFGSVQLRNVLHRGPNFESCGGITRTNVNARGRKRQQTDTRDFSGRFNSSKQEITKHGSACS